MLYKYRKKLASDAIFLQKDAKSREFYRIGDSGNPSAD